MFHGVGVNPAAPPPPPPRSPQPPEDWVPPPAPGPTLRDRVERREREAALRCCDSSCGVGPSDEDPFVEVGEAARRVVALKSSGGERAGPACAHTFHPACLVSAQRASRGWREPASDGEGEVEVVCSVCRVEGTVPRAEWLAGSVLPVD
ncbi:hypothetical protein B0H14DRAFT_2758383 [Mycena olivaceomarginata]|nr:hypothetical protein B0H14DRAFT_2758383 [Mycena olivaceomarginata]